VSERIVVVVGLVVVVVTFFNHNFVSCKATLILEIKNVLNVLIKYNVSLYVNDHVAVCCHFVAANRQQRANRMWSIAL